MIELDKILSEGGEKKDYSKFHNKYLMDLSAPVKHNPVAISIGEKHGYPATFGSYGDYSCIVGASKSKKTFLKSAIVAGYIGGRSVEYFEDIRGHDVGGKYVIDIDTEQSEFHAQRVFLRSERMVGSSYVNHKTFPLRVADTRDRFEFIDWLVYESPYRGKIGLMSIDGYADLLDDFNSLEQSTELTQRLLKWSGDAKCHITGILHKNFGSNKPVGHIGSSVLKKAETVVFVGPRELDKGNGVVGYDHTITDVRCEYSRNIPFDDFSFSVNRDGLPYKC